MSWRASIRSVWRPPTTPTRSSPCGPTASSTPRTGRERDAAAVPDYVRILEAGVNIVSVSTPGLVYPPNYEASFVAQLAAAAERGGVSIYSSGIEPGFAADHLPLLLSTQSDRITSIHSTELFLYADYPVTFDMFDVMGFGMPMDYEPLLPRPAVRRRRGDRRST